MNIACFPQTIGITIIGFLYATCQDVARANDIPCNINLTNTASIINPASGSMNERGVIPATVSDDIVKTFALQYSTFPQVIVSDSAYVPAVVDMYNGTSSLKAAMRTTVSVDGGLNAGLVNMSASDTGGVVTLTPATGTITSPPGSYALKGKSYSIGFTPVFISAGLYSGVHGSWCKNTVSAGMPVSVTLSTGRMPSGTFYIDAVAGGRLYTDTLGTGYVNPATSTLNFTEVPVVSLTSQSSELDFGTLKAGEEKGLPLNIELTSNTLSQPVTLTWDFMNITGLAEFRVDELGNQFSETVNTSSQKNAPLKITRVVVIRGQTYGSYEGTLIITATLS